MEPKQNSPNFAPPVEGSNARAMETASRNRAESINENYEHKITQENPSNTPGESIKPIPPVPILPTPVMSDAIVSAPSVASDNPVAVPTVANDDDLIEKEWVDHAKDIISRTKDDPYLREKEIGKLQADYIRKRYGREIGLSND